MVKKYLEERMKLDEYNHLEFNDNKELVEMVLEGLEAKGKDGKFYCPCILKPVECICITASKKMLEKKGTCHCQLFKLKE